MPVSLAHKILLLRRSFGKNQAEFGEIFGVTQASVSRWEKGSMPDSTSLAKLAEIAGEGVLEFLSPTVEGAKPAPAGNRFMVRGSVAAGVWREAYEWPIDDWEPYTGGAHVVADPKWRFGLRVDGDSMSLVYPHGTILDCVSIFDSQVPESGQRVVVIRKRTDDGLEATVKEYVIDADGRHWLVPRSHNPAFQRPIALDEEEPEIEQTQIIAVVRGSYRPE